MSKIIGELSPEERAQHERVLAATRRFREAKTEEAARAAMADVDAEIAAYDALRARRYEGAPAYDEAGAPPRGEAR